MLLNERKRKKSVVNTKIKTGFVPDLFFFNSFSSFISEAVLH